MTRRKKEVSGTLVLQIVLTILFMACALAWGIWQYNLCYPEVSDSIWYCIQHAFGG